MLIRRYTWKNAAGTTYTMPWWRKELSFSSDFRELRRFRSITLSRNTTRYVMARHETSIPHIAWGYYEVSGTPAATLTVSGPGNTNAMHGLKNAYDDCIPIIHISAASTRRIVGSH